MSILYNVNILIPTASLSGTAYSLYYLKETLKSASWSVLTSSDGTTLTGYAGGTSGTDSINSVNVMNSASAWFRITDPNSDREFVFMRGSTATTAIIKYSRQSKFSFGGSANNLPTTNNGDGVVLLGSQTTDNTAISGSHGSTFMNAVATAARLHIITDNSKYIGTSIEKSSYPWYLFSTQVTTNTILNLYSHESVESFSYSTGDNDPSWFIVAPNATDLSYIDGTSQTYTAPTSLTGISSGLTSAPGRSWYKLNMTGSAFERSIGLIYSGINGNATVLPTYPNTTSTTINPYDSKDHGMPFLVCSVNFPKGMSSGLKWKGINRSFPDIITYSYTYIDGIFPVSVSGSFVYLDKLLVPWAISGSSPIIPNTSSIG